MLYVDLELCVEGSAPDCVDADSMFAARLGRKNIKVRALGYLELLLSIYYLFTELFDALSNFSQFSS